MMGRHIGTFDMGRLRVRRLGKDKSGRWVRGEDPSGDAVQAGKRGSIGRFSIAATITGSFIARPRCCDKCDEECGSHMSKEKWEFISGHHAKRWHQYLGMECHSQEME